MDSQKSGLLIKITINAPQTRREKTRKEVIKMWGRNLRELFKGKTHAVIQVPHNPNPHHAPGGIGTRVLEVEGSE